MSYPFGKIIFQSSISAAVRTRHCEILSSIRPDPCSHISKSNLPINCAMKAANELLPNGSCRSIIQWIQRAEIFPTVSQDTLSSWCSSCCQNASDACYLQQHRKDVSCAIWLIQISGATQWLKHCLCANTGHTERPKNSSQA